MRCPNCNSEVPEGKRFCGHCGHRLDLVAADAFDDDAPTRLYPSEPAQPPWPVQPAPVAAPPPAAAPPPKARGRLPRWIIGLIGGLGLVAVVAAVAVGVALLALRNAGQEQAAPSPTATPTTAVAATSAPTPTPDIETVLIDAIDRANQAEIDALRTLDTSVLEGNVTGDMLDTEQTRVESLLDNGLYRVSTQVSIEFLSFEIADDGTHAQVETLEVWRSETYRQDDVLSYISLPDYMPQTYSLVKVDGRWLVEDIDFHHDPDHIPAVDGLEVTYELVEQRDWREGVEAIVVMLLVENNAGTNLTPPYVFVTFYDSDDEVLVHRRAWCSESPLEAGARTPCLTALTSDREGYPTDWLRYELKPVGMPTDDQPVALTAVEINLLEDPQGNPYITGWVQNDDHRNATVSAVPIFYDEQGRPLEGTYAKVAAEGRVLEPGDTAAFEVGTPVGWDGVSYELRWRGYVTGESPRTGIEIENAAQEDGTITGQLRNASGNVEEYVIVWGLFYDATDQLIAVQTAGDPVRTLSPGQSDPFTIDFPSQVAEEDVAGYELIVQ